MKNVRVGTRNSPLALWQAREVTRNLQNNNFKTEITPIVSSGDKNLDQPLYALGITGVFTKDLDVALLNDEVDIAVHSLKDVPTALPQDIVVLAYLERDYHQDVLVRGSHAKDKPLSELKIATSSLRRRAFWSKEFPDTEFVDIRGNVNTRLQKIEDGLADATMFSLAGLKRLNLKVDFEEVPFLISAPSQGVVVVTGHKNDTEINEVVSIINHKSTQICVEIERDFLKTLEGGCTAPIGAFAQIVGDEIQFIARLCSLDGKQCIEVKESFPKIDYANKGVELANKVLESGGKELMAEIKKSL